MTDTGNNRSYKSLLISLLCGLLALFTVGCGGSSNDDGGVSGGPFPVASNGGFLIQLSAANLAVLYPDPAAPATPRVNPAITRFAVFAFNLQGGLVTSTTLPYVSGAVLNATIENLPIQQYDIVVAGLSATGTLLGSARATPVFPLAGGLQQLNSSNFVRFDGFVLP